MTDTTLNKIKTRIQALLAKANGTNNEHEAELFLAKAMELLQEHQLNIADLVDAGDPILKHVGLSQATSGHAWRWKIYSAVARLYGCKSIHVDKAVPGKGGKMVPGYEQVLVGRESAIITTDLMYPWIVQQIKTKAKEIAAVTGMSEQGQAKRVAAALYSRINRLIEEREGKQPETAAGRNALVVMDAVNAAYEGYFPDTSIVKAKPGTSDALSRAAANSIGLHRQTTTAKPLQLGAR